MLTTLMPLLAAVAYIASAMRLVCFQRNGARIRRGISLIACLLIAALLCAGLEILLYQPHVSPWQTAIAVILLILVYRSRGNLAALLRPTL
ncbi:MULTISPECIES: phage holin family protein [Pseudomonas]|uniref:phage holin family protein n=1 Tax=Pseudomonas TaxID=286 RepID=UPI0008F13BD5|nr:MULTISPECIES: phage holin family protein [Pseudomonas]SFT48860.1 Putative 3TM holin, Phage_holin_3 [Pseudomonas marincola]